MRLYFRNRARYNPKSESCPMIYIEVNDYANTFIWQVKEHFRKETRCAKTAELFYFDAEGICHRLEDGRSVAHYRFVDGARLEATSNPFLAACIYILLNRSEQKKATCLPTNESLYSAMTRSIIHKKSILNILFNSSNEYSDKQPRHFDDLENFIDFIRAHQKKGAQMSHYTVDNLYELQDEFMEMDQNEDDPIQSFIARNAIAFGSRKTVGLGVPSTMELEKDLPTRKAKGGKDNKIKSYPKKTAPSRKKNVVEDRACEHCGDGLAFIYCPDCAEGSVYCEDCSDVLHRAPAKRNHNIQDIAQAPKPKKGYVPQPYRAPFAVIIALYRGVVALSMEMLLSMTEDELKEQAQCITDTDLSQKAPGKWFAGFDCVNNLITKGLLKREATERPTYALTTAGIQLGEKLDKFHNRLYNMQVEGNLPKLPDFSPDCMKEALFIDGRQVCLVIDKKEKQYDRFESLCRERNIPVIVRNLPSGDYLWLLLPPDAGPDYQFDQWDKEQVLPFIVERKSWDDLQETIRSDRFEKQISKMLKTGLKNVFYVVEGHVGEMRSRPDKEQQEFYKNELRNLEFSGYIKVNYTGSWFKTVSWLQWLTLLAARSHKAAVARDGHVELCTYREYTSRARRRKATRPVTEVNRPRYVHHWSGEQFIENIFRDYQGTQNILPKTREFIAETTGAASVDYGEHLLVIEGLEGYNKRRQSELNSTMNKFFAQTDAFPSDVVEECLGSNMKGLVHYDVASYYQLLLQVALGLHVMRTEAGNTTELVRNQVERGSTSSNGQNSDWPVAEAKTVEPLLPSLPFTVDVEMEEESLGAPSKETFDEVSTVKKEEILDILPKRGRQPLKSVDIPDENNNVHTETEQLKNILDVSLDQYEKSHKIPGGNSSDCSSAQHVSEAGPTDIIDLVGAVFDVKPLIITDNGTMDDPISIDDSQDSLDMEVDDEDVNAQSSKHVAPVMELTNCVGINESAKVPEITGTTHEGDQTGQPDPIESYPVDEGSASQFNSLLVAGTVVEDFENQTAAVLTSEQKRFSVKSEGNAKENALSVSQYSEAAEEPGSVDSIGVDKPPTPFFPGETISVPDVFLENETPGNLATKINDEEYARKLQETFNQEYNTEASEKVTHDKSVIHGDEALARKLSEENSVCDKSLADDEALARALYEEERVATQAKIQIVAEKDAELAMQLEEKLNDRDFLRLGFDSPFVVERQTAYVEPFQFSAIPQSVSWGKSMAPSATYTPTSAKEANVFTNQLAAIREERRQHYEENMNPSGKTGIFNPEPPTANTVILKKPSSPDRKTDYPNKTQTVTMDTMDSAADTVKGRVGKSNVGLTCGACGEKGHTRAMKCCPRFYDNEEVERRNNAKAKRQETQMRKAEEGKKERDNTIKQYEQKQAALQQTENELKQQRKQIDQELRRLKRQDQASKKRQNKPN